MTFNHNVHLHISGNSDSNQPEVKAYQVMNNKNDSNDVSLLDQDKSNYLARSISCSYEEFEKGIHWEFEDDFEELKLEDQVAIKPHLLLPTEFAPHYNETKMKYGSMSSV